MVVDVHATDPSQELQRRRLVHAVTDEGDDGRAKGRSESFFCRWWPESWFRLLCMDEDEMKDIY